MERAATCAARTGWRAAAVLAAPQSKFIRVSREQQIYCCLSRFFSIYILRNHSLHLPARGSARSPVIINLFWPNEDEMLTQSSKVKLYIVFRRVPQRRSWICACLCVE